MSRCLFIKSTTYLLICLMPLEMSAMAKRVPEPEKSLAEDDNKEIARRRKDRGDTKREREESKNSYEEEDEDKKDDRKERREEKKDERKERREDRKDNRKERREEKKDERKERREDRKDNRKERHEDRKDDRKERREDRKDNRKERHEDRKDDRKERREDRKDDRRDWQEGKKEDRKERRKYRVESRGYRQEKRGERRDHRRNHRRYVRKNFWERKRYWKDRWHGYTHPRRWYSYDDRDWWIWTSFRLLNDFLIFSSYNNEPVYYLYDGYDVLYIENNYVYIDGVPKASLDDYAEEAEDLADKAGSVNPAYLEMRSLGVWSFEKSTASDDEPTMLIQLAVSKEGIIGGMYQNSLQESVEGIEGAVDPLTQRVAWRFVGKEMPVMETALGDLTSEEGMAKVLVYFEDGRVEEWTLIRLDQEK